MSKRKNIKTIILTLTLFISTFSLYNANAMEFKQIEIETPKEKKENKEKKEKKKYGFDYTKLNKIINEEDKKAKQRFLLEVEDIYKKFKDNEYELMAYITDAYLKSDLFKYVIQSYKILLLTALDQYERCGFIDYDITNEIRIKKKYLLNIRCLDNKNKLNKEKFIDIIGDFIKSKIGIDLNNIDVTIPEPSEEKLEKYFNKYEQDKIDLSNEFKIKYDEITKKFGKDNENIKTITPKIIKQFKKKLSTNIQDVRHKMIQYLEQKSNEKYVNEEFIDNITKYNKNMFLDFISLTENNELNKNKFIETLKKFKIIDNNSKYIINKEEELKLLIFLRKYKTKIEKENLKETTIELLKTSPILQKTLGSIINSPKKITKDIIEQFKNKLSETISKCHKRIVKFLEEEVNKGSSINRYYIGQNYIEYITNYIPLTENNELDKNKFIETLKKFEIIDNNSKYIINKEEELKLLIFLRKYKTKIEKENLKETTIELLKTSPILQKTLGSIINSPKKITKDIIEQFKNKLSETISKCHKRIVKFLEEEVNKGSSINRYYIGQNYIEYITNYIPLTENNELDKNKFIETLKKFEIIDNNSKYIINKEEELNLLIFLRKYKTKIEKENLKETTIELLKTSPILKKALNSTVNNSQEKNIQAGNEIPSNVILDENNKVEDKIINEKKAIADGIITRNNLNLLKKEVKKIYPCKNNSKNLKVKINYEIQNKKNKKENLDEPNKNIIKNNSNLPKKEIEKINLILKNQMNQSLKQMNKY